MRADRFPGKQAARRDWLACVVTELEAAQRICTELGLPGIAYRIASARAEALALQSKAP